MNSVILRPPKWPGLTNTEVEIPVPEEIRRGRWVRKNRPCHLEEERLKQYRLQNGRGQVRCVTLEHLPLEDLPVVSDSKSPDREHCRVP